MIIVQRAVAALLFIFVTSAGYFTFSWRQDQAFFRDIVATQVTAAPGTGAFVEELDTLVYHKEGFEKCPLRYGWDPLGPTPRQVWQSGGDCADKSRLLSAMLRASHVESTLVMLQPCRFCEPTHTIVNAVTASGDRVAADPVYDIVWPVADGGYYGVAEIRDHPDILSNRLAVLKELRGPDAKINFHSANEMKYGFPKTINWDKNRILGAAGDLVAVFDDEPFLVDRPDFMESPKLFLATLFLGLALVSAAALVILSAAAPRRAT